MAAYKPSVYRFFISLFWFLISCFIAPTFEVCAFREGREGKDYSVIIDLFWTIYHTDDILVRSALIDITGIGNRILLGKFRANYKILA